MEVKISEWERGSIFSEASSETECLQYHREPQGSVLSPEDRSRGSLFKYTYLFMSPRSLFVPASALRDGSA